jgi:hypothetical protein
MRHVIVSSWHVRVFGLAPASRAPRNHPVDATSVAKAKVQSIAPVEGASRDAVASESEAGMF